MATIYTSNYTSAGDYFFGHAWYATRTMLKAGWLLKHSSNATAKATGNPANPDNCRWGAPAALTGQSGSVGNIGAQFGKDFLITGLTGLVPPTNTNSGGSEGNILALSGSSGASYVGNNVNWMITQVVDATSCYARPLVPSTVTANGGAPTMTISGHLARTTAFDLRVNVVTGGTLVSGTSGTITIQISLDGGSTYASNVVVNATNTLNANNSATCNIEIIDKNGIATGIYLTFAGTTSVYTNSHYWTAKTAVANDPSSITWAEKSWLTTAYPTLGNYSWIVMEGPATLKIPFTSLPSGTFVKGENIVQSSTGAEGELMGITYDSSGGYMVVSPRVQGTGIGAEGWNTSSITGALSSASATPSATPVRLVREQVWVRGNILSTQNQNGALFYQPVLDATENTQRFGWASLQAGCTATVVPGGGGTNNAFPTIAYASIGRGDVSPPVTTPTINLAWTQSFAVNTTSIGRMQLFTANCVDRQNQSCDGSYVSVIGIPSVSATTTGCLPIFMRLDGGDEGDIEPYGMWTYKGTNGYWLNHARNGTDSYFDGDSGTSKIQSPDYTYNPWQGAIWAYAVRLGGTVNTEGLWQSWWRRGLSSAQSPATSSDLYFDAWPVFPYSPIAATYLQVHANNTTTDTDTVAHSAQTTLPVHLQPIELVYQSNGRKGYLRWIFLTTGTNGSVAYDTFANKTWLQCASSYVANAIWGLKAVIPYDGSSTPVQ